MATTSNMSAVAQFKCGEISTERVVINTWLFRTEPPKNPLKGPNVTQETGGPGAAHAELGDAAFRLELKL